jgi:predicted dehydrogenase
VDEFSSWNQQTTETIHEGTIGEIVLLNAGFGIRMHEDANNRFYNKALAGGSLLDMGVYPLTFSRLVFQQKPQGIHLLKPLLSKVMAVVVSWGLK